MKIDLTKLPHLWYSNADGAVYVPTDEDMEEMNPPPEGFIYQHSMFPNIIRETVLRLVQAEEVENCPHLGEDIRKTYGWIEGIEGRECQRCHGMQLRKTGEKWSERWDAEGSRDAFSSESSFPEDLVVVMLEDYSLGDAMIIASQSCERCLNALAHKYGLKWGYEEGGEEWKESRTECSFCKEEEPLAEDHSEIGLTRAILEVVG